MIFIALSAFRLYQISKNYSNLRRSYTISSYSSCLGCIKYTLKLSHRKKLKHPNVGELKQNS